MGVCGCSMPRPGGCPACNPNFHKYEYPSYSLPAVPVHTPMGCICPPTSEQTCGNPTCPRRAPNISACGYTSPQRT